MWLHSLTFSQYYPLSKEDHASKHKDTSYLWGMQYVFTQNYLFKVCKEFSKACVSSIVSFIF